MTFRGLKFVMVFCMIVACHNRSERDKGEKFFRVPAIILNQGEDVEERTRERRERWISAISRDDLSEKILNSDKICSRHFVSGCPAKSWDFYNIDWVPTLHLGHSKFPPVDVKGKEERAERAKSRRKRLDFCSIQTFSSYKHHNTIKVLIGISPQGTITFASEA